MTWLTLLRRSLAGLTALLLLLAAGGLGYRALLQQQRLSAVAIATANGVMEERFVEIGGIEQWVKIRGKDRANPVLLYVHGGPGGALSPFAVLTGSGWEEQFTVVEWDQRGAGKTRGRSGPITADTTIRTVTDDGIAVAEYALERLGRSQLVVVGSSWGSVIGVIMAQRRPDLVSAYVGTGQFVSMRDGERLAYELVLEQARAAGNSEAVRQLHAIGPPPWHTQDAFRTERGWAQAFESSGTGAASIVSTLLTAPYYSLRDSYGWILGLDENTRHFFGAAMDGEFMREEIAARGIRFGMPVIVIQGERDNVTPVTLAQRWLGTISAPSKQFITIPNAGHTVSLTHGRVFLRALTEALSKAR